MSSNDKITNVVFAGLGGQGVLTAARILADAAFRAGYDVKQSEIHGMSQRGGSVTSDVRFGKKVWSFMVPVSEAEFLVVLDSTQLDNNIRYLRKEGVLISPQVFLKDDGRVEEFDRDEETPLCRKNFNIALLGALSTQLEICPEIWTESLHANLPKKVHEQNEAVFELGRIAQQKS